MWLKVTATVQNRRSLRLSTNNKNVEHLLNIVYVVDYLRKIVLANAA